jgi:hypothetical protein
VPSLPPTPALRRLGEARTRPARPPSSEKSAKISGFLLRRLPTNLSA